MTANRWTMIALVAAACAGSGCSTLPGVSAREPSPLTLTYVYSRATGIKVDIEPANPPQVQRVELWVEGRPVDDFVFTESIPGRLAARAVGRWPFNVDERYSVQVRVVTPQRMHVFAVGDPFIYEPVQFSGTTYPLQGGGS